MSKTTEKLLFKPSGEDYYRDGDSYVADNYKIVHYDYLSQGSYTEKKQNWRAYIRDKKSGLFGWHVNPEKPFYRTRKEAENACNKHLVNNI